jgi:hypothetical protein
MALDELKMARKSLVVQLANSFSDTPDVSVGELGAIRGRWRTCPLLLRRAILLKSQFSFRPRA